MWSVHLRPSTPVQPLGVESMQHWRASAISDIVKLNAESLPQISCFSIRIVTSAAGLRP
jgi:hypothetical protein